MRVIGGVSLLTWSKLELRIPPSISRSLGVDAETKLWGVVLDQAEDEPDRQMVSSHIHASLVLTPLPPTTWGRLVRICFTIDQAPGQILALVEALDEACLWVRTIDSSDGINLATYTHIVVNEGDRDRIGDKYSQRAAAGKHLSGTTVVTVEVPAFDDSGNSVQEKESLAGRLYDIIKSSSLESAQSHLDSSLVRAKRQLQTYLQKSTRISFCRVEWISPLRSLAALKHTLCGFESGDQLASLPRFQTYGTPDTNGEVIQYLSLDGIRGVLHHKARSQINTFELAEDANVAVISSGDSDERIMCFDLIPLSRTMVAQFRVQFPAGRLEHEWHKWLLKEVRDAGGNVHGYSAHGRLRGKWRSVRVIATFPFVKPNGEPSLAVTDRIVRLFRRLKGFEPASTCGITPTELAEKVTFAGNRVWSHRLWELSRVIGSSERRLAMALRTLGSEGHHAKRATARYARYDSMCHDVKLWYKWPGRTGLDYRRQYVSPFDFTRPLDRARADALNVRKPPSPTSAKAGQQQEESDRKVGRLELAARIVDKLLSPTDGSVLIIGAHRSGKTSQINLVESELEERVAPGASSHDAAHQRSDASKNPSVAADLSPNDARHTVGGRSAMFVRINAATTPPHFLVRAILQALLENGGSKYTEVPQFGPQRKAFTANLKAAADAETEGFAKWLFGRVAGGVEVGGSHTFEYTATRGTLQDANYRLASELWSTPEGRCEFLNACLVHLKNALAKLDQNDSLIVAIDEFSECLPWGDRNLMAVWRHIIESSDYRSMKLLITSTRPIVDASGSSTLGSALREYWMEPLSQEEAHAMVDAFESRYWEYGESESALPPEDRCEFAELAAMPDKEIQAPCPTVTFDARQLIVWCTGRLPYLMQVLCVSIFDQAIARHIPVITKRLVIEIIKIKVRAELNDYFATQFAAVPEQTRAVVAEVVTRIRNPLKRPIERVGQSDVKVDEVHLRQLQLVGLGGGEAEAPVVPLFADWHRRVHVTRGTDRGE